MQKYANKKNDCPHCGLSNLEKSPDKELPESYNTLVVKNHQILSSKISEEEIKKLLFSAAKKLNFEINSCKIEKTQSVEATASILPDPENPHSVNLQYSEPLSRCNTIDEMEATCMHELLHIITNPPPLDYHPEDPLFHYARSYGELINKIEMIKRFPNLTTWQTIEERKLPVRFRNILLMRNMMPAFEHLNFDSKIAAVVNILIVLSYTCYFSLVENSRFNQFINQFELQAVWNLLDWVNHDMIFIHDHVDKENYEDVMRVLDVSNGLVEHFLKNNIIQIDDLIKNNTIKLNPKVPLDKMRWNTPEDFSTKFPEIRDYLTSSWKSRLEEISKI